MLMCLCNEPAYCIPKKQEELYLYSDNTQPSSLLNDGLIWLQGGDHKIANIHIRDVEQFSKSTLCYTDLRLTGDVLIMIYN